MRVRHTTRGALALSMLFAISIAPSFCADHLKNMLLSAYKSADYGAASKYGERLVARSPADYDGRYYLANAYVMTHQNDAAINEYRLCLHNSKSESIKAYSAIALERLLKLKEKALSELSRSGASTKTKEIRDFENKVTAESYNERNRLQREWDQALAAIGNRPMSRDWYRQRQDADNYQRERAQINQTYSRRMSDLAQYKEAMLTQTNCGLSKIRLAPSLSSRRVKNYVNYGDESEAADIPVDNPLRAQALPLDAPTKKSTKSPATTTTTSERAKTFKKPPAVAHQPSKAAR